MAFNFGTKILILLISISFVFTIAPNPSKPQGFGYDTGFNKILLIAGGNNTNAGQAQSYFAALLTGATLLAAVTSTIFPNMFTLFAGLTSMFITYVTIPWDIVGGTDNFGIPLQINGVSNPYAILPTFIYVVFSILVYFAVVSFYKGNDF